MTGLELLRYCCLTLPLRQQVGIFVYNTINFITNGYTVYDRVDLFFMINSKLFSIILFKSETIFVCSKHTLHIIIYTYLGNNYSIVFNQAV